MESIKGLYKSECIGTTVFHDGPLAADPAGWAASRDSARAKKTEV